MCLNHSTMTCKISFSHYQDFNKHDQVKSSLNNEIDGIRLTWQVEHSLAFLDQL